MHTLSYLGQEAAKADSKAFASLMSFIRDADAAQQTVIAVPIAAAHILAANFPPVFAPKS